MLPRAIVQREPERLTQQHQWVTESPCVLGHIRLDNDVYAKLAALTPPSDLQSVWSQYLGGAKALISTIAPLQAAAEAGDSKKAQALADEVKAAGDKLDAVASRMGLTECAKDVQPQG